MKTNFLAALLLGFCLLGGAASADNLQTRKPGLFNRLDVNNNGVIGRGDLRRLDCDNNPPGRVGGRGTNWENPPGRKGGPGTSPDQRYRKDHDNNPPGRVGGRGTNWKNPPGRVGGAGASPNRRGWR